MAAASDTPAPDPVELAEHYDTVFRGFTRGHVVPVLGAGANLVGRPAGARWARGTFLPSGGELAAYLADAFDYPDRKTEDLLRVSQYVAVVRGGTGPLYDTLHEVFDADYPTTVLHDFLAGLPAALRARGLLRAYPLVLTTNYDDLLERAFDAIGESYDVCMYVAAGEHAGKFRHKPPDGDQRIIDEPEAYVGLSLDKRPVILKVHGFVERGTPIPEDSYVITEDHYIDYLTRTDLAKLVPVNLLARLRSCHFLFLGYSMRDWNLRAILHRLWAQRAQSWDSWAIQLAPDRLERESWERRAVRIFGMPLDAYFAGLGERLDALLEKAQPAS
jgi:hypothetical protein